MTIAGLAIWDGLRMFRIVKISLLQALAAAHVAAAGPVDHIVINKTSRTLVLLSGNQTVASYRDIKLGGAPVGPKHFEHDQKTPEGVYTINGRNAGSHYHLSLRISYPNAADRAYAAKYRRSPGGDIFIHGLPNSYPFPRAPNDWTDGCVALTNPEIEKIWALVQDGTKVTIQP
jgi:murein L,D-transpeptidase YafK